MSLARYLYNKVLLEADDDDNEETATDYTSDNNVDGTEEPEGNVGNDDIATDYTQDGNNEDNQGEEDNPDDEQTENNGETDDGEPTEGGEDDNEQPTDYTADADGGEDNEEDDTTDDTATDDTEGGNNKRNTLIKNYNLLNDFNRVYNLVNDTISNIESTIYGDVVQNKIVNQVLKNLTRMKEFILAFIKYHFNDNLYEFNLYYYETIMTSLELNLKILSKIKEIPNTEQNSKKLKKRSVIYNGKTQ